MPPNRPLKVFLCHASQDKPVVRELSRRLASEGWIDPWIDEKKLLPGQDWRTKIEEAVETSDIVIICLSSNSVSKEGFVQKELRYAREIAFEKPDETIFLVPLRLDDCIVPRGLRFYQWGDYFGEKKDDTYNALLESLKLRHEQKLIIEKQERVRKEKEKQDREAAEKNAREKTEREAIVKAARKREERDITERVAGVKAEHKAAEEPQQFETPEPSEAKKHLRKLNTSIVVIVSIAVIFVALIASVTPLFKSTSVATETSVSTNTPPSTQTPVHPMPTLGIGPIMISDKDGMKLMYVPAGNFQMGSNDFPDTPVHTVYLDAFWIDQTDITNKMYALCDNAGVCQSPTNTSSNFHSSYYGNSQFDNYPVIYIDWNMAKTYCEWAGRQLPSEAQWEKAARGTDGRTYPWGNSIDCSLANYGGNGSNDCVGDTTEVGAYPSGVSPYGALDMAGNVWQWVADWYDGKYYSNSPSSNPLGPTSGQGRVLRGGPWEGVEYDVRSAARIRFDPDVTYYSVGFRCARSVQWMK